MKTLRTWVCSARLLGPAIAALLLATTFAPAPVSADTDLAIGGTGVIAYANGDNVKLRTGPSYDDSEIDRFPEGSTVSVLDGPIRADDGTDWFQVTVGGQTGYIVSEFLANSDGLYSGTTGDAVTRDSVNVRSGPSTADGVVLTLGAGERVTLTGGNTDGWLSVSATGGDGWVYGAFLGSGSSSTGTRYTIDTVHLRSGPGTGYSSITYLDSGVQLELTGEQQDGFVKVTSSFGTGWVAAQYIGTDAPSAPEQPESPSASGTRYTIDTVHLRSGPGTEFPSITYLEIGVQLELTGDQESGFAKVESAFGTGWVSAQYIGPTAPEQPAPENPAETGTRYTIDTVHLREGPGTNYPSIQYLVVGEKLELTGEEMDGFVQVTSAYSAGWVSAQYIGTTAPADPEPEAPAEAVTRYTTSSVNLRSGASATSSVVTVLASGSEVQFAQVTENGFSKVTTTAGDGWISSEFLSELKPEVPSEPEPSNSLVTWPVRGGEWYVSQGYNGSSHQNRTQYWQYYYSFDLKRSDGSTAGQSVYSPVNGTIRWIDESTGGMSIYMGNGLAFAMFHMNIDPGIQEGDTLTQGQYMGTIAPDGQAGNGGTAHLHISAWSTSDEGNWSRQAIPFTGSVTIEGVSFPATGTGNDYRGYTFNP